MNKIKIFQLLAVLLISYEMPAEAKLGKQHKEATAGYYEGNDEYIYDEKYRELFNGAYHCIQQCFAKLPRSNKRQNSRQFIYNPLSDCSLACLPF